jgi:hypothetical protein
VKIALAACRVFGAIALLFLASSGVAAGREAQSCEYRSVVVDAALADEAAGGREIAEPLRRAFLQFAADALPSLGIRVVENPEDAFWTLTASRLVGPTSVGIFIELTGSIELQHHLYIADLADNSFSYRGEVGGNHYIDILPDAQAGRYRREAARAVRLLWGYESEQVAALCGMSAQLKDEGWMGIRELRLELIDELKRARAERARVGQTKRLELNVEGALPQGSAD